MEALNVTLLAPLARTATEASPGFDSERQSNASFFLNVTAASGTTPTLDLTIQDSPDGVTWYNRQAFTQVTGATTQSQRIEYFGRFLRVNAVIGGTTPSFTFSVKANIKG